MVRGLVAEIALRDAAIDFGTRKIQENWYMLIVIITRLAGKHTASLFYLSSKSLQIARSSSLFNYCCSNGFFLV